MAVTSLHAISVLEDSPRPAARQLVTEGSQRAQSSIVLQMWRKIEDVQGGSLVEQRTRALRQHSDEFNDDVSTQTSESSCNEQRAYLDEIAQNISCCDSSGGDTRNKAENRDGEERSLTIGEDGRERVRQIFQDWKNCGGREPSSNQTQMIGSSRAQWLGENERERVRVVRKWVQLTAQDRGSYSNKKEIAKIGAEIEMVRDGLVVEQHEGRPNRVHRKIRRLCGKQALVDLVLKAEKERQFELEDLAKHHAVSRFPHRNRIQASLKGRFLRNNVTNEKQKTRSIAAGELGLLRQRQTVSGLREGFLSRAESSSQSYLDSVNDRVSSSSNTVAVCTNDSHSDREDETKVTSTGYDNSAKENLDTDSQSLFLFDLKENRLQSDGSQSVVNEQALQNNEVNQQGSVCAELTVSNIGTVTVENAQANTDETSQCQGQHMDEFTGNTTPVTVGMSCGHSNLINLGSSIASSSVCRTDIVTSMAEGSSLQRHSTEDNSTHVQSSEIENGRLDKVACTDGRNSSNDDMDNDGRVEDVLGQSLDHSGNDLVESVLSELSEGDHTWDASETEDSVEEWIQRSSRQEQDLGVFVNSGTVFRLEENVRTSELNDLISRRRVSNLLESGFRENLNRLLQTYVERQAQSSMGWDLNDSMSSPASEILHQGQQTDNENDHSVETFGPSIYSGVPPPHVRRQQLESQVAWPHTMHQPLGFQDWEVINDLRMDITTLQLRMNDMQRMLEACMDMQLELQRSIRQEVSAALNRSIPPGSVDSGLAADESKWDFVRKGICCVCSERNIDSLLYRCGHMCTCTKCANELLNEKSKCPMCRSPIVQVIRAYSAQQ